MSVFYFGDLVRTSGGRREITSFRTCRGWAMSASQQPGQRWGQVTAGRSPGLEGGSRLRAEVVQTQTPTHFCSSNLWKLVSSWRLGLWCWGKCVEIRIRVTTGRRGTAGEPWDGWNVPQDHTDTALSLGQNPHSHNRCTLWCSFVPYQSRKSTFL